LQPFVGDGSRDFVSTRELAERDVMPERAQARHDDAAALVDRQNLIGGPM
jgi:hypothetical protein